ncbi:zip family metal cation transporter [Niveomyces insectorum RCEF 264]|uniref:Zip family metal cation transporter n=1 Tax=Niveomyces insectorum RCEF 264 TaxID=1081102 RepID=A0A167PI46_9HYPO|nr:zip family metal cation transporter [Niveomyces insectorum RCEF 264]
MAFFARRRVGVAFVALAAMLLVVSVLVGPVAADAAKLQRPDVLAVLDADELNARLQECAVVQALGQQKKWLHNRGHGFEHDGNDDNDDNDGHGPSSMATRVFAVLFPGRPAVNALLATLYISGPPNFLLALCPPDIDPAALSVMVAFAVGGLLGDTLFHLLPEIFVGEDDAQADRARLVLVEPNRNLLLGVAILVGFLTFVAMDKGLRIATGGDGDGGHDHHNHNHSHSHNHDQQAEAVTTSVDVTSSADGSVAARKKKGGSKKGVAAAAVASEAERSATAAAAAEANASVRLSGYLNLIADFTHNITDGLAMAASFYASPTIGATTTVAVFFHEIPHEVGDFALLVQSGFSKRAAMGAQFVTALGALLGTVIGILVQEFGGNSSSSSSRSGGTTADATTAAAAGEALWDAAAAGRGGLLGTSLSWGDLLLPFTAGTFLYVGTVAVIPELLATNLTGSSKRAELRKTVVQFGAIAAGAGIMLYISWH